MSAWGALAVLDVIDDERVLERVQRDRSRPAHGTGRVAGDDPAIGDVRGVGLAVGCRIRRRPPRPANATARAHGRSVTGCATSASWSASPALSGNVLKIRPPLALTEAHVPPLVEAFATAVSHTG